MKSPRKFGVLMKLSERVNAIKGKKFAQLRANINTTYKNNFFF